MESFNGTFRAECLNRWLFADGQEAQQIIEQWRREYNHHRAHSSLGYVPPDVMRLRAGAVPGTMAVPRPNPAPAWERAPMW